MAATAETPEKSESVASSWTLSGTKDRDGASAGDGGDGGAWDWEDGGEGGTPKDGAFVGKLQGGRSENYDIWSIEAASEDGPHPPQAILVRLDKTKHETSDSIRFMNGGDSGAGGSDGIPGYGGLPGKTGTIALRGAAGIIPPCGPSRYLRKVQCVGRGLSECKYSGHRRLSRRAWPSEGCRRVYHEERFMTVRFGTISYQAMRSGTPKN
jgi:hypothetical protein